MKTTLVVFLIFLLVSSRMVAQERLLKLKERLRSVEFVKLDYYNLEKALSITNANRISTSGSWEKGLFFLPHAEVQGDTVKLYLMAIWLSTQWVFLREGDGLEFTADGLVRRFSASLPAVRERHFQYYYEGLHYSISFEELETLANATALGGKIYAQKEAVEIGITGMLQKNLKSWCREVVPLLKAYVQGTSLDSIQVEEE